jgi:glycosyltransferase involved in cell wall biosynthesis
VIAPEEVGAERGDGARRVVYVAYHFPPQSSSGTFRLAGFARHLPRHGWIPLVVAPRARDAEAARAAVARSVPGARVWRAPVLDLFRLWERVRGARGATARAARPQLAPEEAGEPTGSFRGTRAVIEYVSWLPAIPDRDATWIPFAVKAGLEAHAAFGAACVFASGPPWSALVAGRIISRLAGIPLLADFRDPWTGPNPFEAPFASLRSASARLEARVVQRAARVTFTTEETMALYARRYPTEAGKLRVVTNGIDEEEPLPARQAREGVFSIVHTGEIYGERRLDALFEALSALVDSGAIPAERVRVVFVGGGGEIVRSLLDGSFRERRVAGIVTVAPPVSHAEAMQQIVNADLLLSIGFSAGVQVPGKLFEYLRAGRPILALDRPGGAVARVLARAGGDYRLVPRDDARAIEAALSAAFADHAAGRAPRAVPDIEPFRRRRLTADLAAALDDCVNA